MRHVAKSILADVRGDADCWVAVDQSRASLHTTRADLQEGAERHPLFCEGAKIVQCYLRASAAIRREAWIVDEPGAVARALGFGPFCRYALFRWFATHRLTSSSSRRLDLDTDDSSGMALLRRLWRQRAATSRQASLVRPWLLW